MLEKKVVSAKKVGLVILATSARPNVLKPYVVAMATALPLMEVWACIKWSANVMKNTLEKTAAV